MLPSLATMQACDVIRLTPLPARSQLAVPPQKKTPRIPRSVKKADWKLYNNVSWEQRDVADSEFEAGIWISLVTAKPAPIMVDKLMSAHPNPQYRLQVEGSDEVCLGRVLHAEEVGMLDELLRDLDGEWARLWREIGGLKQFLDLPVTA